MAITVMLANNSTQRSIAYQLVRDSYLQAFKLDINDLNLAHNNHFHSDVLLAVDSESQKILGTMSLMFPNSNGIFPCESLFGFDLTGFNHATNRYIEIGRFATSPEGKKNRAVVISLFLGAVRHLESLGINGWVATVKDDVFGFLEKISLRLNNIHQVPRIAPNDPLMAYVGKDSRLHLFDVSLEATAISFQRFDGYLSRGAVEIYLGQ